MRIDPAPIYNNVIDGTSNKIDNGWAHWINNLSNELNNFFQQDAEPELKNIGSICLWNDTKNKKYYVIAKISSNSQKKVELT
jgi:hypothetical protein